MVALCNFIYKILSNILANWLHPLLVAFICPEQSGYVEGHQILYGIITAHEGSHFLKIMIKRGMLTKTNISKSFEKLSWSYLFVVLRAFGFWEGYIEYIGELIFTPLFSIIVNGSPTHPFKSSWGIRQGDAFPSFLFILVAKGLGHLIKSMITNGTIKGLCLYGYDLPLTHQQFVDDTMLMDIPCAWEAHAIRQVLSDFTVASGMYINFLNNRSIFLTLTWKCMLIWSTYKDSIEMICRKATWKPL